MPTLAAQQVNFINLNGSYNATFKAKCLVAGCSINFNLGRYRWPELHRKHDGKPRVQQHAGNGLDDLRLSVYGIGNGHAGSTLAYSFTCTGTCLMQDADVVEGSTLPGNTTAFRDAVVSELQQIHPGSIRYMDNSQWCQ